MNTNNFKRLLESQGLKATVARLKIFELFTHQDCAATFTEIEQGMASHMDRVTLYRTLKTFEAHGLIYRIPDTDGPANFALTSVDWNGLQDGLTKQYLHFSCLRCKSIYCLDGTLPKVTLPDEYKVNDLNIVITGICAGCNKI